MAANMYRVGDYVYFDITHSHPYQIRRIEELIKSSTGNVEAKVLCFYRRKDISSSLISLADKHHIALEEEQEIEAESLNEKQKHQLKHRELFFSRQIETLPVTHIRGKCNVTLLNEVESLSSYLNKDDSFFYTLVYESTQKTLLADRGEIRVGSRYQAEVPQKKNEDPTKIDDKLLEEKETLVFKPNSLIDIEIEQYLTIVKSIGTFGRALDHSSSIKQPSLHLSASCASRDITIQKAMDILHENNYDIGKALLSFTSGNVPTICKDELEEWSPSEAALFEESLDKYGKSFRDIRQEVLPWKKMKNIVEYYYMWKTTDRYVHSKRVKAIESESKLKQVYIPNYNNKQQTNNGVGGTTHANDLSGKPCESCSKTSSSQWYAWGSAHSNNRLCQGCWTYWKKFGGLKYPSKLDHDKLNSSNSSGNGNLAVNSTPPSSSNNTSNDSNAPYNCSECNKSFNRQERLVAHMVIHRPFKCNVPTCGKEFRIKVHLARHCMQAHGVPLRSGSPRPIMKTRAAFFIKTSNAIKVNRRLFPELIRIRHAARNPFELINSTQIKAEFATNCPNEELPKLPKLVPVNRGKVVDVAHRLGIPQMACPEWLIILPKKEIPQTEKLAFPPLEKDEDGRFILPKPQIIDKEDQKLNSVINSDPNLTRKRTFEHSDLDSHPVSLNRRTLAPPMMSKQTTPELLALSGRTNGNSITNGKARISIARVGGKNKLISWVDAPDDVYFVANEATRKLRLKVQPSILKRSKRRPWIKVDYPPNYDPSLL